MSTRALWKKKSYLSPFNSQDERLRGHWRIPSLTPSLCLRMRCPTFHPRPILTPVLEARSLTSLGILVHFTLSLWFQSLPLPWFLTCQHIPWSHSPVKTKTVPLHPILLSRYHLILSFPPQMALQINLHTHSVHSLSSHSLPSQTLAVSEIDLHSQSPAGAFCSLSGCWLFCTFGHWDLSSFGTHACHSPGVPTSD